MYGSSQTIATAKSGFSHLSSCDVCTKLEVSDYLNSKLVTDTHNDLNFLPTVLEKV